MGIGNRTRVILGGALAKQPPSPALRSPTQPNFARPLSRTTKVRPQPVCVGLRLL